MRIMFDPEGDNIIQVAGAELTSEDQVIKFIDALILAKDFVWPTVPEVNPEASAAHADDHAGGAPWLGAAVDEHQLREVYQGRHPVPPAGWPQPSAPRAKKRPRK